MDLPVSQVESFILKLRAEREDSRDGAGSAGRHGHVTRVSGGARRHLTNPVNVKICVAPYLAEKDARFNRADRLKDWRR